MKVSICGAGKLGLPVALAIESKGHEVMVYDINPAVYEIIRNKRLPYMEEGAQMLLDRTEIKAAGSLEELVKFGDIIFVPIQTPHDPRFEGITPLTPERMDFDYSYLKSGIKALSGEIAKHGQDKVVIIISTVLPGTIEREIKPLLNNRVKLCYNPFFIAMGTTIRDFLQPEFVLFGVDDPDALKIAKQFYATLHDRPVVERTIQEAELIKVAYNTFIGQKLVFANNLMEICHKMNINVDAVTDALKMGTDRLISPKYLGGGMGDGGNCHPRDGIAMSWLASKLGLSYDWSESVMIARERQTDWLASLVEEQKHHNMDLPIVIMGTAYKPGTNLTGGSPALLLKNILEIKGYSVKAYDPYVNIGQAAPLDAPAIFFIGTRHDEFVHYEWPAGSIVIDPWRFIPDSRDSEVIAVGKPRAQALKVVSQ